uniref:Uncharacterized protein n=1 Tax=Melopsittacus undulatus TaxID=13146 RepID=A0A8V5GZZ6_MELUD
MAVTRLLAMAEVPEEELNPFHVLGVEATATDTELRRAYRRLAVLVHPDKNEHPQAEAAFKVLRAAWDVVSSPERSFLTPALCWGSEPRFLPGTGSGWHSMSYHAQWVSSCGGFRRSCPRLAFPASQLLEGPSSLSQQGAVGGCGGLHLRGCCPHMNVQVGSGWKTAVTSSKCL